MEICRLCWRLPHDGDFQRQKREINFVKKGADEDETRRQQNINVSHPLNSMSSIENAFINRIPLDLASISPDNVTSTSLLHGIITIKWPYSSSSQKLTFLLADPDPRKRASGGQVKITLLGEAAGILDQTESGESISLSPSTRATVDSEPEGQRAKWHITFPEGCILQAIPFIDTIDN